MERSIMDRQNERTDRIERDQRPAVVVVLSQDRDSE